MFDYLQLQQILDQHTSIKNFWIAYSGGLDSHVLLHAMTTLRQENPSYQLHAIHINHGLHPDAAQWALYCQAVCEKLSIPLTVVNVQIEKTDNLGIEAAARIARYQAIAKHLPTNSCLLTAHTINDQVETTLLQLLRGSGPKGLAAMPVYAPFAGSMHLRPLLQVSRDELEHYAKTAHLKWIDDPSNTNIHFDRNYLRHEVVPKLLTRWPSALTTIARSAKHCAEADKGLKELAIQDWQQVKGDERTLIVSNLLTLSATRQLNLLRWWLHNHLQFALPPTTKLIQIQQMLTVRPDAQPEVNWHDVMVRRHRERLYAFKSAALMNLDLKEIIWDWRHSLILPNQLGELSAKKIMGGGIVITNDKPFTIKFRQGGERCHPAGRVGSHPLKKLFQEWDIPPWQRDLVPLLYIEEELVAVVGYCIDQRFVAKSDQEGVMVSLQ